MDIPRYNVAVVRDLIRDAFTADGLWRFCQDRPKFWGILPHFGSRFSFEDMIQAVIEQCQTQALLPELLAAIREHNPKQYNRYGGLLELVGGIQKVFNLPPLDMTHTFKDRQREIVALRDYLADERVHLVSIVGRGGWGKTALACHVLADLQKGMLLDLGDGRERPIDGILYLGTQTTSLGLERIYADTGRMLGEPAASKLATRWTHGDTSLSARVGYLLEAMQDGLYLILLDNLEDHLTEEGEITDEGLRLLVERCLLQPGGARLIATSRQQIRLPAATLPRVRNITLDEGLPEDDASALLHELDPQGRLGLRDASEEDLQHTIQLTQGIPRALELLAGILNRDPTTNLTQLLADESLLGEQVVDQLVKEGYRRLGNEERRVMEVLAVFDRPVEMQSVAYLLSPWFSDLDFRTALRHLVNSSFVSASRDTGEYGLHPLDREYAYHQLTEEEEPKAYNRRNLELRAADYYASIRKTESEWRTIEDLAPQLAEFEHRVYAGECDDAYQVLDPDAFEQLQLWGHYAQLVRIRAMVSEELKDPYMRMINLCRLGRAYYYLGQYDQARELYAKALTMANESSYLGEKGKILSYLGSTYGARGRTMKAICYHEEALAVARDIGDRRQEANSLRNLGVSYHYLGQIGQAIRLHKEALTIARDIGDREEVGRGLSSLGIAYRIMGDVVQAIRCCQDALAIARERGYRRGEGSRLGLLGNAYQEVGKIELATDLYLESLSIAREIGNQREKAVQLNNLGDICLMLGQSEQAIKFFRAALHIVRHIDFPLGEERCLSNLGSAFRIKGQVNQAMEWYNQALTISRDTGDRRGEGYQLLGLGRVSLCAKNQEKARAYCKEALALDMPEISFRAALVRGIALLPQANVDAENAFSRAVDLCQVRLDKTSDLFEARYSLATALTGCATAGTSWAKQGKRDELLSPALQEYQRALRNCGAPGVVQDTLRDLELIRAAGVEGLEPVFELLENALAKDYQAADTGSGDD